ncbi:alpha/beta hydrolase [Butyrivibrio sp.]|uniref:alpha/beta hydrolase n=1 Tax=Butyrivibrio sp. TaxID=28121 RepID=UPI0025B9E73F|nr:alpha/beta hydrolase [Butyrivibrio sp.]MBE5839365.1 alpha/beta hydrolase [Butyrivibrio sp.]
MDRAVKEKIVALSHVATWILAISLYMAFNYIPAVGIVMIVLLAAALFLKWKNMSKDELIVSCIIAVGLLAGMIVKRYSIRMVIVSLVAVLSLYLLTKDTRARNQAGNRSKIGKALGIIGYALSGLICLLLFINIIYPDGLISMTQGENGKYPSEVSMTVEDLDDMTVYRDVTYESQYENSTYTVYSLNDSKGVFFYIHGGGLVWGDKEAENQNVYLNSIMNAGYSVVTVDYVLAPQNPFPQSVIQVNEALKFFIDHAGDYDLDTSRIIVGGDSAGGMLSGLLAVTNTNPEYAKKLGVTPAVSGTAVTLKGYISIAGLVDVPRFGDTGNFLIDWMFNTMGRSAFGIADYDYSNDAKDLGSVLNNITQDFPPTYASDGNNGTFTDQGKDLISKLNKLGISTESYFPDRDVAVLYHTWELNTTTEQGQVNIEKTIAFMDEYMK